jgi:hypothetical protein
MRKIITIAGLILVAAIAIAWSKSTYDRSKTAAAVEAAPIAPTEIMVKHGSSLPAEYWMHPF